MEGGLGHVIEHVALKLQCLAGMNCGFGRTRSIPTNHRLYNVIFSYEIESAGLYAVRAAFEVVHSLAKEIPYDKLTEDINYLKSIFEYEGLGISTKAIVDEA